MRPSSQRNRTGPATITSPTTDTKDGDQGPMLRLTLDPHHLVPAKDTNTETTHTPRTCLTRPQIRTQTIKRVSEDQAALKYLTQTLSKPSAVPFHCPHRLKHIPAVVAHNVNTIGMDSRYDPTINARQDSDVEDNSGEAVRACRDRQKCKQQGADRLNGRKATTRTKRT
jgi:hypothetical protein